MKHAWQANFENGTLHISGNTKYPNDFSVAGLERVISSTSEPGIAVYQIVFHQDKEPYCGANLIGPVHHFESDLPPEVFLIRVLVDGSQIEIPVPKG